MATLRGIAAALSALALFTAAPALALSVSTGVGASVGVGEIGVSVRDSANATSGAATASSNAGASADLSIPLVITRGDVSAGALQQAPTDAGTVETKGNLSAFIQARLHADVDLTSVDAAPDHVAVTYEEPGLFLGILPIDVETTATTDASGNVTVTGPWWNFLAATDQAKLQTSVNSSVEGILGAGASANAQLSVSQQAQLVSVIESALAAAAHAGVSANASAGASAN